MNPQDLARIAEILPEQDEPFTWPERLLLVVLCTGVTVSATVVIVGIVWAARWVWWAI